MATSDMQGGYFKKYAREHRIQTTEENFSKGIKFEQTPLDTGEHKMMINYDLLNEGRVITPRKGIRTIEVDLPLTTPDLYPKITEDMLLTNNLDAIEEDGTHYRLFVANQCSEQAVGLHSGPAELWVVNKDSDTTQSILDEYNIETRDMYAIDMSFEVDSIKDVEQITDDSYEDFFSINKLDYNAKFDGNKIYIASEYKGGVCFRVGVHPFNMTVEDSSEEPLMLYKAKRVAGEWVVDGDPIAVLNPDTEVSLDARKNYYLLCGSSSEPVPEDDPYMSIEVTTEGAKALYDNSDETFISGTRVFTYHIGEVTGVLDSLGATVEINAEKYFKRVHEAGEQTYTFLLNTIEHTCTVAGSTVEIDRSIYNRIIAEPGTKRFLYVTNKKDDLSTNVTGASVEIDIHRFNRMKPTAGTYTFTYNSTNLAWQIDSTDVYLSDYGILFKDPNGARTNGSTITVKTVALNLWQVDDIFVVLKDYGITFNAGTGTLKDGDSINVKSVTAGVWLDENDDYVKAYDYGIDIIDPDNKVRDGDTLTVTTTVPTSWQFESENVDLQDYGVIFEDPLGALANGDTITIDKIVPDYDTWFEIGHSVMETPGSMYYIPADANGNGFPLFNNRAAKAIGTFAWNNNYYNFNSHGELIRSRYQTTDNDLELIKTYYTEALTPRSVTASEAISSGFNMLLDDPYTFEDRFEEGDINLEGVMLYDDNDNLISEPVLNIPYKLRCFYSVEHNTRYKISWSYREINTSDWIDIQENEYFYNDNDATLPDELIVPKFSCPIENAVIRVQAFKWDKEAVISYSTSVANASVIINTEETEKQFKEAGRYNFSYDGANWKYLGKIVNLSDYGITYSDITAGLKSGSTLDLTIEYKTLYKTEPENVITMSVVFSVAPSSTTANKELKNYDLSKATGMVYWKGHIWLYGLAEDPTVLFASDINEPTYFPYPNNIDIFDEPVLLCAPFNDNLLVFTRSTLYKLTLSDSGYWTTSIIQADLNFTEFDMNMVRIVKNMVFFKSGDYYYMVVPKTLSLQNELAIAPVSKNIEKFLDNFVENIKEVFKTLYEYEDTISLTAHYNFLNYEDVHNVYAFELADGLLVNFELLYNTVDRYWRVYMYESQELYRPLRQDATKQCDFYAPLHGVFDKDGETTPVLGAQILEAMEDYIKDFYIPKGSVFKQIEDEWQPDEGVIGTAFEEMHVYKNWTLLDCGYRNIITDYKKRCRELQFKFNNISGATIRFLTEFILDGETRFSYYKYTTEQILDPTDPNWGLIYIERTPVENLDLPGVTTLAEDTEDINAWELDYSRFPEVAFWKSRFKVSGKGYTPRFKLMTRTEENYELIGYSWVYRAMYSR